MYPFPSPLPTLCISGTDITALLPLTFYSVKDDRGYEAKIDFQDAEAVRCLAETLLQHDFGIYATFSLSNLCPTVSTFLFPALNNISLYCMIDLYLFTNAMIRWQIPNR